MTLERERHAQFKALRVFAEWFRYQGVLVEHISGLPNPIGWLADDPSTWTLLGGWQRFHALTAPYETHDPSMPPKVVSF